jgi:hypothetical protein
MNFWARDFIGLARARHKFNNVKLQKNPLNTAATSTFSALVFHLRLKHAPGLSMRMLCTMVP